MSGPGGTADDAVPSGVPDNSSQAPREDIRADDLANLVDILQREERLWRASGNESRAERYAIIRRIVDEESARSAGRPSPLLTALAQMYGTAAQSGS